MAIFHSAPVLPMAERWLNGCNPLTFAPIGDVQTDSFDSISQADEHRWQFNEFHLNMRLVSCISFTAEQWDPTRITICIADFESQNQSLNGR